MGGGICQSRPPIVIYMEKKTIAYKRFHQYDCGGEEYLFDQKNKYLFHSSLNTDVCIDEELKKPKLLISPEYVHNNLISVSSLIFEVTEGCNLSCRYCGYGENYSQPTCRPLNRGLHMTWEISKTVLDYYFSLWEEHKPNKTIDIIFYGGEPLVNFKLIEKIVNYIEKNKPPQVNFKFFLTTNGILVKKYLSFFVHHSFTISISIDGDTKANQFRVDKLGRPTFKQVINNINYIYKTEPLYFEKYISFQSVINTNSSVLSITKFFKDNYNKYPMIIELSRHSEVNNSKIDNYYKDVNADIAASFCENAEECKDYRLENPLYEKFKFILKTFTDNYYRDYKDFLDIYDYRVSSGTCLPFQDKLLIAASGLLFQCEKTDFEIPLGKIEGGNLIIDEKRIAEQYTRIFNNFARYCINCINKFSCRHCFYYDRDFGKASHRCSDFVPLGKIDIASYFDTLRNHSEEFELFIKRYSSLEA